MRKNKLTSFGVLCVIGAIALVVKVLMVFGVFHLFLK